MKKICLTVALAFAFAMPFAESSDAEQRTAEVNRPGYLVPLWKTTRSENQYNNRSRSSRSDPLPLADLWNCRVFSGTSLKILEDRGSIFKVEVSEGNKKGCQGWIRKTYLKVAAIPTHTRVANAGVDDSGKHWKQNMVPIFNSWDVVYKARDNMRDRGNYDRESSRVVCTVPVGTKVKFIERKYSGSIRVQTPQCTGWILEWNLNWR